MLDSAKALFRASGVLPLLTDEEFTCLSSHFELLDFIKGGEIQGLHATDDKLHFVVSGMVTLTSISWSIVGDHKVRSLPRAHRQQTRQIGTGGCFGENCLRHGGGLVEEVAVAQTLTSILQMSVQVVLLPRS